MSNEEVRKRLYKLNVSNKAVRNKMMKTLKLASEGEFDHAALLLDESRHDLERVKEEHSLLRPEIKKQYDTKAERSIGFTEALQATVAQAAAMQSRQCSAVKFHVYN